MGKLAWYFNRLRAMNTAEVCWRMQQKLLQRWERSRWETPTRAISAKPLYGECKGLRFRADALGLNFQNPHGSTQTSIHLPGGYDYATYKRLWSAGFQTKQTWPNTWSYALDYKQRDDIGDARTNWELNRHFQFALLAKAAYVSGERKHEQELHMLFDDWNRLNPWLHGICWVSVMEVAIRCIQWCVALAFLNKCKQGASERLTKALETGIANMAAYVSRHYSRFSSANNHLLVEACALAYAGFAMRHKRWQRLAIHILDQQLKRQYFEDGVNKEMALHYQTFAMEAYALTMHLMQVNNMKVPATWTEAMKKQCEFVAHCGVGNHVCAFGDDDEGKVLDLKGGAVDHYRYVLQLCSLVVEGDVRYDAFEEVEETIGWLFNETEIERCKALPLYDNTKSRIFVAGGYSLLRSNDQRVVVGIDHAPLGFGSIAAHGHADALSFQLFVDERPVFIDPGTYIYHCWLDKRNDYRKSINHNTVTIHNTEQSEMLGAFLWGKKAQTRLTTTLLSQEQQTIGAETMGMSGVKHARRFVLKDHTLTIEDEFERECPWVATFLLAPDIRPQLSAGQATCKTFSLTSQTGEMTIDKAWASSAYGLETPTLALRIKGTGKSNKVIINIAS